MQKMTPERETVSWIYIERDRYRERELVWSGISYKRNCVHQALFPHGLWK